MVRKCWSGGPRSPARVTSSCGGRQARIGGSLLRPSTGACPLSAASTVLLTLTGGSAPTPPSMSAGLRSTRAKAVVSIAVNSAPFCSRPSATTTTVPRWRRSWASMGSASARRVAPTSKISALNEGIGPAHHWQGQQAGGDTARSTGRPPPSTWPSGIVPRDRSFTGTTDGASIVEPRTAECAPSGRGPGLGSSIPTCSVPPSSWRRSTPVSRCGTFGSPLGTPIRGPRPSMTAGQELDRHAAYVVVAFVAGG